MTNKQLEIARKCIYACETGGQVYGNARYDCYVGNHTNSDKETACTIGAGGNHAGTAKKLVQSILDKYPTVFRAYDTAGIESDLKKSWESYDPGVGSAKAKCIQKIISTPEGIKCQDELLNSQILARAEKVNTMGITDIDAQIFAAEIIHLGGYSAFERVLKKTSKPYSMDNIYKALKTDQNDTSSNNQVGDKKYWSRHEKIYRWLKEKISNIKEESKVSITEKDIIICGHGSGNPSTKNMYTYNSQRYASIASNGKRKGVVCVLRLKALTDSGRTKYHDTYKTILGRNIYNQNLRSYVYKTYNGKYYSDCSSSICATFAKIGYNVSLLNTAGMYYSSLFEKVPVNISNGHITNPEILKVGDCLMYAGSDPSRPLQIGHVESVYEIKSSASNNPPSSSVSDNTTLQKGSSGSAVKTMQIMLIACGYSCGNAGADGDFGDGTLKALKAFQKDVSLVADGIYGSASKTALQAKYKAVMASQTSNTEGNVAKGQRWLNTNYGKIIKASTGKLLTVDNSYGTHSRNASLAVWKDVVNRKYGKKLTPSNTNFGTSCIASSPSLTLNSEGTLVYILQFILSAKCFYTGTMSARYTTEVKSAVIAYQKSVGLTQDGICGGKTWNKLFN